MKEEWVFSSHALEDAKRRGMTEEDLIQECKAEDEKRAAFYATQTPPKKGDIVEHVHRSHDEPGSWGHGILLDVFHYHRVRSEDNEAFVDQKCWDTSCAPADWAALRGKVYWTKLGATTGRGSQLNELKVVRGAEKSP
tara:strand:- start:1617 stop:2030 length:414 start_codon:yes stop_codon:yes gene_type:complete